FLSRRRRHTRSKRDWSSDVCSSDLGRERGLALSGRLDVEVDRAGKTYAMSFRRGQAGVFDDDGEPDPEAPFTPADGPAELRVVEIGRASWRGGGGCGWRRGGSGTSG